MKLRTKLPLFLIPLVIAPLFVVSWLAFDRIRANTEENILHQMNSLIQQITINAETVDRTMKANAVLFSGSSLLKDFIFSPEGDRYHFALLPLLNLFASYHNAYPNYDEIRVVLPDGREDAKFSVYQGENGDGDDSKSPWFTAIKDSSAETLSIFQWDSGVKAPTMVVANRIMFVDPTFEDSTAMAPSHRGYLVITANLDHFRTLIAATRIGRSGGILILDPKGRPLYPDAQRIALQDPGALLGAARSARDGAEATAIDLGGDAMLIQSRALPGGLTLIGYLPESELVQAGQELGRLVAVIGVVSVVISVGLLMLVLQGLIVRPLNRLGAGAQAIGGGRLETRLPVKGHDEVSELATQFNAMAENLVESRKLRDEAQAETLRLKEAAIASLREADRLKDEFLANTSHELRTPLHGITGIAESLLKGIGGPVPEIARDNLLLIVSSARRLTNLVNDILDFSKLRHNALKLVKRPVDLKSACDLVISMVRILAEPKGLRLENRIEADLPPVMADENRLHQILYNLIGNAVKFTSKGFVVVKAFVKDDLMHVLVEDSGIGVPENKREIIFKSFEQLDGGLDRAGSGTGLGLTITRQLVESHGGAIEVRDRAGGGSVFAFTLWTAPLTQRTNDLEQEDSIRRESPRLAERHPAEAEAGGAVVMGKPSETATRSDGEHILVVDDEVVNLRVIENHLLLKGYTVSTAASGGLALEFIEKQGDDIDLILLDVMMPGQSGFEVCEIIRRNYKLNQLPVVFLTALTRDGDLEHCFDLGANDYIPKPFSYAELLARISLHLALSRQSRDLHSLNAELEKRVRDRTQALKRAYDDMERLANLDGLTGVSNRRALDQALEEAWSLCGRTDGPLSYVIVDIDHFKAYNDLHGHQSGDACLHAVALELSHVAKAHAGFLGRYGGEEFSLILHAPLSEAILAAREMCSRVAALSVPHGGALTGILTLSAGVSARSEGLDSVEDLIAAADKALYQAKQGGRNRVATFAPSEPRGHEG